ncbi:MAG: hypothetical protein NVSMB25_01400 [Thermoleophilaceae bacterium]
MHAAVRVPHCEMAVLSLETYEQQEEIRIEIGGELDLSSALTFDKALRRAERHDPKTIVLDLRTLKFMDSTGLRVILSAHTRGRRCGRRLAILGASDTVRRIFSLAGVLGRLETIDSNALEPS